MDEVRTEVKTPFMWQHKPNMRAIRKDAKAKRITRTQGRNCRDVYVAITEFISDNGGRSTVVEEGLAKRLAGYALMNFQTVTATLNIMNKMGYIVYEVLRSEEEGKKGQVVGTYLELVNVEDRQQANPKPQADYGLADSGLADSGISPHVEEVDVVEESLKDVESLSHLKKEEVLEGEIIDIDPSSNGNGSHPTPKPAPKGKEKEIKFGENSPAFGIAAYLWHRIIQADPAATNIPSECTLKALQGWAVHADRLLRLDLLDKRGMTREAALREITAVIDWCQLEDDFWPSNIRSTKKLREKYDQLRLKRQRNPKHRKTHLDRMMEEEGVEPIDLSEFIGVGSGVNGHG